MAEKMKRHYADPTESWPVDKRVYNAFVTGAPGTARKEPVKLTMPLYERAILEGSVEWEVRFHETLYLSYHWNRENYLDPDKPTGYLNFPPIFEAKMELNTPATILLYGRSVDNMWVGHDDYTMEAVPHLQWKGLHYEDGICTLKWDRGYESATEIMERRHIKTGEKFKDISMTRNWSDGGMLQRDIIMDIRNELAPEYAMSACHLGYYTGFHYYSHGYPHRASIDAITDNFYFNSLIKYGWPTQFGPDLVPRPPAFHLLLQNHVDIFSYRFNGLVLGDNWGAKHTMTPLEVTYEIMGEEIIPPRMDETCHSCILYGMDRWRTMDTYVH